MIRGLDRLVQEYIMHPRLTTGLIAATVSGGAALALGVTLFLISRSKAPPKSEPVRPVPAPALAQARPTSTDAVALKATPARVENVPPEPVPFSPIPSMEPLKFPTARTPESEARKSARVGAAGAELSGAETPKNVQAEPAETVPETQRITLRQPVKDETTGPEFDPFQAPSPKNKIISQKRKSAQTIPLEIIRDFLTDRLQAGENLKIWIYSNPQPVRIKRKKAMVLRVVYEVRSRQRTEPRDQVFLLQDAEVKHSVDTAPWIARFRQAQPALSGEERAMQQALATQLAQRPVNC
jgi:hypothetical protein